jgi:hypothetical protein
LKKRKNYHFDVLFYNHSLDCCGGLLLAAEQSRVTNTLTMSEKIEYDILNGKKYKRLLKAYIKHVRLLTDTDLLDSPHFEMTDLSEQDAIDLTIIQQID